MQRNENQENYKNYGFPYTPYESQKQYMDAVYSILNEGKIGILESPTGTGKSLSLLCSSIYWLIHASQLPDDLKRIQDTITNDKPKWIQDLESDSIEKCIKRDELKRSINQLNENIKKLKTDNFNKLFESDKLSNINKQNGRTSLLHKTLNNKKKNGSILNTENSNITIDDSLILSDEDESIIPMYDSILKRVQESVNIISQSKQNGEKQIHKTKIYICSRTHSQLNQLFQEFKKTVYYKEKKVHCILLGSRKLLCVNKNVNYLKSDGLIQERCLEMQRETKKENKCPYKEIESIETFSNYILSDYLNIEDLYTKGELCNTCPYYSVRNSIPYADVVFLTYNLILNKEMRTSLDIQIKNGIFIFDEAHNILDTINELYSPSVNRTMLQSSLVPLQQYLDRYQLRLSGYHISYIQQILIILNQFILLFDNIDNHSITVPVLSVGQFRMLLRIDNYNIKSLYSYCQEAKLFYKLNGFCDSLNKDNQKNNKSLNQTKTITCQLLTFFQFLLALSAEDKNGCICCFCKSEDPESYTYIQYINLKPSDYFKDIINNAWSIIFTGGTMKPIDDLIMNLFPEFPKENIKILSLPHIVPSTNYLPLIIPRGYTQDFTFNYTNLSNSKLFEDSIVVLLELFKIIPDGIIIFFPSSGFLSHFMNSLISSKYYKSIQELKTIFCEPKNSDECEQILQQYATCINTTHKGVLFCIVRGKLSEGINFNDQLARCVIMYGIPFANSKDIVIKEKMKYYNKQSKLFPNISINGQQYYINLCMKATNQCIGRALRHKEDWASIIFMDSRYQQQNLQSLLPTWIQTNLYTSTSIHDSYIHLKAFYKRIIHNQNH